MARTVQPVGVTRRVQALCAIGWPARMLAGMLGVSEDTVRVGATPELADAVANLYGQLHKTPGPSSQSVAWAKSRGWFPPLAWEESTIDDPDAVPDTYELDEDIVDDVAIQRAVRGDVAVAERLRDREREEAARYMLRRGVPMEQVRSLLGTSERATRRIRQEVAA